MEKSTQENMVMAFLLFFFSFFKFCLDLVWPNFVSSGVKPPVFRPIGFSGEKRTLEKYARV